MHPTVVKDYAYTLNCSCSYIDDADSYDCVWCIRWCNSNETAILSEVKVVKIVCHDVAVSCALTLNELLN